MITSVRSRSTFGRSVARSRPADVRFRSLGAHRFHGLREAQRVFQVEAPDLPARFPPLRTAGQAPPAVGNTGRPSAPRK